jgi:hypothetical protein
MPSRRSLKTELESIFQSVLQRRTDLDYRRGKKSMKARKDSVYEAYLYAIACQALHEMGCMPVAVNSQGNLFVVRRAPARLDTTRWTCSYVSFTKNKVNYELYCDVKVMSRSPGVTLEVDILILPAKYALDCDNAGIHPDFKELRLLVEAKNHAKGIDMALAKSFVGICDRLRTKISVTALVSSGPARGSAQALLHGLRPPSPLLDNVYGPIATSASPIDFKDLLKRELNTVL